MARGAITVKIDGQYDDKDLNRAIKDLNRLKTQSGAASSGTDKLGYSMKSLVGAAAGMVAFKAVAGFVKDFATEAVNMALESRKTSDRLDAIAKSMGVYYGVLGGTTGRLQDYAQELQNVTGVSDETTKSAQAILLTFKDLASTSGTAGGMFDRATAALLDLSAAGFGDATTNAKSLGKALQDPIKGLTALGRQGITFTAQEKEKIKALVASNNMLEAQNVIMAAVEMQVGGTAESVATDFDKMSAAAADAQENIGFALLDAVESAVDAFGGSGGMVEAILAAGDELANFVAGIGVATTELAGLLKAADDLRLGTDESSVSLLDLAKNALVAVPAIGSMYGAWTQVTGAGEEYRASQDRIDASLKGSEALYAGYISSLDGVAAESRQAAMTAEDLAEQLQDVKDNFLSLTQALNASQSMDDFRKDLHDLDETLKGNSRTFKGMGDAAKENRDTLRGAFGDAAAIAQKWAEDNGKSAEQAQAYYERLGGKIVDQFVRDGFKRKDVEAFLGGEGVWVNPAENRMKAVGRKASVAAYAAGTAMGRDLGLGTIAGLAAQSRGVQAAGMRLIAQAEAAARAAAESNSPSKLFARVGKDLTLGLVQGVREGGDDVRTTLQGTYKEWFTTTRATLKDGLDAAKAEFKDFSASVSSAIMGGIDFGAAAPTFDEAGNRVGATFIESLQAQASKAQEFAAKVKELVTAGLSREALTQVLGAGVTAGTAIANELITGGATAITTTNELVATTQAAADKVGLGAAQNFYGAGVASAQATYNGFRDNYGRGGPAYQAMQNVMDNLASSMRRETTVTVTTVNRLVSQVIDGKRAAGGPVTAGKAYLVGEKGPELFIPNSDSGMIMPNSDLPSASMGGARGYGAGNSYSITVQAGVGDPRQIGQQVVEYIRRFEQANGNVFAAA